MNYPPELWATFTPETQQEIIAIDTRVAALVNARLDAMTPAERAARWAAQDRAYERVLAEGRNER